MKTKKIIALLAAAVLLVVGVKTVIYGWESFRATNVEVTRNEDGTFSYERVEPDGVADIIVEKNVNEAKAVNNVAAVVFDFRGYDTLGESFILLTAIAGSFVILARNRKEKDRLY